MRRGVALAACLAFASCEAPAPSPPPPASIAATPLDSAVAASVGDMTIRAEQIARVAAAQGIAPAEARDLVVRDALFAAEARARGIDLEPEVDLAASGLLTRTLVQDIAAQAEARGPVTDAELDEVTARHWTEIDRPDAARIVHAVVMPKKDAPPEARARAAAIAETIRKSIAPATDVALRSEPPKEPRGPEDPAIAAFRKAVNDVPKGDFDVRVEAQPPVVADGRTTDGGQLEDAFAQAAVQLARRGDVSPVVQTSYGYHVLLLLERIPGHIVPREERRAMVREEVISGRARLVREKLLGGLRSRASIDRSVDALLALVPVDR